ncbi:hypothetical protein SAMN04515671_1824 [Nakamurella panacisegetis]|uniref:Uncharacterized protein n=1 Tax=Nakamurella panacisegetis TaxID=1090615 RepID=A0A1H0LVJ3_9ACTN|nr:hypothetical protein [Nakamurella panacisegetis]SDO72197.1 hypothetical protein SAMN04515671_1824 [Nakamurella panacisegetis]
MLPSESDAAQTQTVVAAQLHVTDLVRRDGMLRAVTSIRVQGVPPEVCVEFNGLAGRFHYPATTPVLVVRPARH